MKYNLGANNETECGNYYQWGDTVGYTGDDAAAHSTWATAPFNNGFSSFDEEYFTANRSTWLNGNILKPEYDAVYVATNGTGRMPTKADMDELVDTSNCTSTWVTNYNSSGINGRLFTSVRNGNTLFIPAAGYYFSETLAKADSTINCWSSSLSTSNLYNSYYLYCLSSGAHVFNYNTWSSGMCIRGLIAPAPSEGEGNDEINQIYLHFRTNVESNDLTHRGLAMYFGYEDGTPLPLSVLDETFQMENANESILPPVVYFNIDTSQELKPFMLLLNLESPRLSEICTLTPNLIVDLDGNAIEVTVCNESASDILVPTSTKGMLILNIRTRNNNYDFNMENHQISNCTENNQILGGVFTINSVRYQVMGIKTTNTYFYPLRKLGT